MFFGTPVWAVPSLNALTASEHEVVAAVTNPDRPAGRGMSVSLPPVKRVAWAAGLQVLQPPRAGDPVLRATLERLAPDVAVAVAYGKILPQALLDVPRLGFVNVHFSLLPEYRGAAPVQRAIMDGKTETGVSIMVLTAGMDEGPVLASVPEPIGPFDTGGSLGERLAALGARLLVDILGRYGRAEIDPQPQDHVSATYAPKPTSQEARIDWSEPAHRIADLVRALNPEPGAWTTLRERRVKVHGAAPAPSGEGLGPGEIAQEGELHAGTGSATLALTEVQAAGGRRMTGRELANGLRLSRGDRFV